MVKWSVQTLMELSPSTWRIASACAFGAQSIVTFGVGTGSAFGWIGRALGTKTNVEISEKYNTLVTPAGYAFAIWGPIYAMEAASMLWQFGSDAPRIRGYAVRPWLLACGYQSIWTLCFGKDRITLSTATILLLAERLAAVYDATRPQVGSSDSYALGHFPFALHYSWVACASIVNVNLMAVSLGSSPRLQLALAMASEVAAFAFGAYTSYANGDPVPAAVSAWALLAIGAKPRTAAQLKDHGDESLLMLSGLAKVTAAVLLAEALWLVARVIR